METGPASTSPWTSRGPANVHEFARAAGLIPPPITNLCSSGWQVLHGGRRSELGNTFAAGNVLCGVDAWGPLSRSRGSSTTIRRHRVHSQKVRRLPSKSEKVRSDPNTWFARRARCGMLIRLLGFRQRLDQRHTHLTIHACVGHGREFGGRCVCSAARELCHCIVCTRVASAV